MGKVIIIASGKGGTGKTTLTAHLGAALASAGHLTAVIDADAGFRNLDIALGLESSVVYDYSDFILGDSQLDDVLVKDPDFENLYFVAAPQSASTGDFDEEKTARFWDGLKDRFEFVIADAPAGMGDGFVFAAEYADEAIIIALAETSALRDADRVIAALEQYDVNPIRLVLNRVRDEMIERKVSMNVDDCIDVLSIPILGIIPEDDAVAEAMSAGKPQLKADGCSAGTAIKNIADRILGNQVPMMKFEKKKKSLMERFFGLFVKS